MEYISVLCELLICFVFRKTQCNHPLQQQHRAASECAVFSVEVYFFSISAGRSSKRVAAAMCQCALAQTGYFASMCLMSPT